MFTVWQLFTCSLLRQKCLKIKSLQSSLRTSIKSLAFSNISKHFCISSLRTVGSWAGGLGMRVPRACLACILVRAFVHVLQ